MGFGRVTELKKIGRVISCRIGHAWQYYALDHRGEIYYCDGAGRPVSSGIEPSAPLRATILRALK